MPDSIALISLSRSSEPAFLTASAHSLMPWYCETAISCTILVSPKRLAQRARKSLFAGVVVFLAVVAGDQDAVALGGREREVLVADAEGRRARAGSSCSCPTPPTGGRTTGARRRPARRTTKSGFACWILAIVEPKSATSSGKKSVFSDRAAALLDVVRDPLGGDLAVVVVGREHVDLLAPLLHARSRRSARPPAPASCR